LIHLLKNDHSGVALKFDPKLLAGLKAEAFGVGVANQQVSIAMHSGSEFRLTTTGSA
tara:strand:+ start:325 stop:495 length:171 start_codon:yes stop_codon:yes gene_type:complete